MRIVETERVAERIKKGCVLIIGNFDGVHIGHQAILAAAREAAGKRRVELVAMTFQPHPLAVLNPEKAPQTLTPARLKGQLLSQSGVDLHIVIKSSQELLRLSAEEFLDRFITKGVQPAVVVEGDDFNFGAERAGSIHMLKQLGSEKGFEVIIVGAKLITLADNQTVRVSSSLIRYMLRHGHVADAAMALGRAYRLIEKIIPGRGKGKRLGFGTLNLARGGQLIPAEGVYAGFVGIGDSFEQLCNSKAKMPAAFSIGISATYGGDNPLLIEAHLLGKDPGESAGKYMAMDFVERIREQKKFETEKELTSQIAKDCEKAEEILATVRKDSQGENT